MKLFRYNSSGTQIILLGIIHLFFHVSMIYGLMHYSLHWLWLTVIGTILIRHVGTQIGGHRYYAHNSFETKPWTEWLMSISFVYSYGGSHLRWIPGHCFHHKYTDTEYDNHSPHHIKNIKDFIRVGWPPMIFFRKLFNSETDKKRMNKFSEYFREENYFKHLYKNKAVRFSHNYYWLIAFFPLVILPIIDIRLLIYFIAIPCVINGWSLFILNFFGHVFTFGSYRNYKVDVYGNKDHSTNSLWLNLVTGGEGMQNNHHRYPRAYNFKMSDKWHETDFLNTFLIEKFLKA